MTTTYFNFHRATSSSVANFTPDTFGPDDGDPRNNNNNNMPSFADLSDEDKLQYSIEYVKRLSYEDRIALFRSIPSFQKHLGLDPPDTAGNDRRPTNNDAHTQHQREVIDARVCFNNSNDYHHHGSTIDNHLTEHFERSTISGYIHLQDFFIHDDRRNQYYDNHPRMFSYQYQYHQHQQHYPNHHPYHQHQHYYSTNDARHYAYQQHIQHDQYQQLETNVHADNNDIRDQIPLPHIPTTHEMNTALNLKSYPSLRWLLRNSLAASSETGNSDKQVDTLRSVLAPTETVNTLHHHDDNMNTNSLLPTDDDTLSIHMNEALEGEGISVVLHDYNNVAKVDDGTVTLPIVNFREGEVVMSKLDKESIEGDSKDCTFSAIATSASCSTSIKRGDNPVSTVDEAPVVGADILDVVCLPPRQDDDILALENAVMLSDDSTPTVDEIPATGAVKRDESVPTDYIATDYRSTLLTTATDVHDIVPILPEAESNDIIPTDYIAATLLENCNVDVNIGVNNLEEDRCIPTILDYANAIDVGIGDATLVETCFENVALEDDEGKTSVDFIDVINVDVPSGSFGHVDMTLDPPESHPPGSGFDTLIPIADSTTTIGTDDIPTWSTLTTMSVDIDQLCMELGIFPTHLSTHTTIVMELCLAFSTTAADVRDIVAIPSNYDDNSDSDGAPPQEFRIRPSPTDDIADLLKYDRDIPEFDCVLPTVDDTDVVYLPTSGGNLAPEEAMVSDSAVLDVDIVLSSRQDGDIAQETAIPTAHIGKRESCIAPAVPSTTTADGVPSTFGISDTTTTPKEEHRVLFGPPEFDGTIDGIPLPFAVDTDAIVILSPRQNGDAAPAPSTSTADAVREGDHRVIFGRQSSITTTFVSEGDYRALLFGSSSASNRCRDTPITFSDDVLATTSTTHCELFDDISAENSIKSLITTTTINDFDLLDRPSSTLDRRSVLFGRSSSTSTATLTINHRASFGCLPSSSEYGTSITAPEGDILSKVVLRDNNGALLHNDFRLKIDNGIFIASAAPSPTTADSEGATFRSSSTSSTGSTTTAEGEYHRISFGSTTTTSTGPTIASTTIVRRELPVDISAENSIKSLITTTTINHRALFGHPSSTPDCESVLFSCPSLTSSATLTINSCTLSRSSSTSDSTSDAGDTTTASEGDIISTVVRENGDAFFFDNDSGANAGIFISAPAAPSITTAADEVSEGVNPRSSSAFGIGSITSLIDDAPAKTSPESVTSRTTINISNDATRGIQVFISAKTSIEPPNASTVINDDYSSTAKVGPFMVVYDNNNFGFPLFCSSSWKTDDGGTCGYTINYGLGEPPQLLTNSYDQHGTTKDNRIAIPVDSATEGDLMQVATIHPAPEGACLLSLVGTTTVYFDNDDESPSEVPFFVQSNNDFRNCNSMQFHVHAQLPTGRYLNDDNPDSSSMKHLQLKYHWILDQSARLYVAKRIGIGGCMIGLKVDDVDKWLPCNFGLGFVDILPIEDRITCHDKQLPAIVGDMGSMLSRSGSAVGSSNILRLLHRLDECAYIDNEGNAIFIPDCLVAAKPVQEEWLQTSASIVDSDFEESFTTTNHRNEILRVIMPTTMVSNNNDLSSTNVTISSRSNSLVYDDHGMQYINQWIFNIVAFTTTAIAISVIHNYIDKFNHTFIANDFPANLVGVLFQCAKADDGMVTLPIINFREGV